MLSLRGGGGVEGAVSMFFGDFLRLLASLGLVFCLGAALTDVHRKSHLSKRHPRNFGGA